LAIESTALSVAEVLMAMAFDYATRAANAPSGQQRHHQIEAFGD
jgi:hypothetical protein